MYHLLWIKMIDVLDYDLPQDVLLTGHRILVHGHDIALHFGCFCMMLFAKEYDAEAILLDRLYPTNWQQNTGRGVLIKQIAKCLASQQTSVKE